MTRARQHSDDRERALIRRDALDETLVVEAAAGTGKTTELVARIVRILATGRAPISSIAAVTFTEKAAGELKLRLRQAVEEARRTATAEEAEHLDAALRKLEEAHVTTIHGFCAELLRERPVEAGIDPLFQVMTEAQAARLFNSVFDRWLQETLATPPEGVRRLLRRRAWPRDEEGSVDGLRRAGLDLSEWRDFGGRWTRPAFDHHERIDSLCVELGDVARLLANPSAKSDALFSSAWPIRTLAADIERVEAVAPRDYDGLEAEFVSLARHRELPRLRKGSGDRYREGVARVDVWRAIEGLRASLEQFDMDANADLAALLQHDLRGLLDRYARAKSDVGVVDFLDLLLQARDLIKRDRDARASFQQRFSRIFVDEFQDTDPLQAEVLLLLAADDPSVSEWREVRPVPGKLFLVGDPKQSIYRFRRADVGVYRDVYRQLEAAGARRVTLRKSFRARPNLQRTINAAFSVAMTDDETLQQAGYVPLEPDRADLEGQPSVAALPVPRPYATQRIAASAIDASLPDAVGAYIEWLVNRSGWQVEVRNPDAAPGEPRTRLVRIEPGHICVLFRRFVSYDTDVTRPYVDALEARGIPHLLVGGRSFHNRAEVEALRAALAAIERPDDELSVFATLRGPFFGVSDEDLLHYKHLYGRLNPFGVPVELDAGAPADAGLATLRPIAEALSLLQSLHRGRNRLPVPSTIARLLEATRVHVRFALEQSGEQVLANVLRIADLARQYEAEGGISFRGFLEELDAQADEGRVEEAPILEEASDGVRLMTVHKAKGLEFPVVILGDMTAKLRPAHASRHLDSRHELCAIRLAGCSPDDLTRQEPIELAREAAEGVRLAYVAATRARDLLVVPVVGDEEREGWLETLNPAVYPPVERRRSPADSVFRSRDSVLSRPQGDPASSSTVSPGRHQIGDHEVVWWDPRELRLDAAPSSGLRHTDLIAKTDVEPEIIEAGLRTYEEWRARRMRAIETGETPGLLVETVTRRAAAAPKPAASIAIEILHVGHAVPRPRGRRFGTLVHSVLAAAPLDASAAGIRELAESLGRSIRATAEEIDAAVDRIAAGLALPLFNRVRLADAADRCRRELPIAWWTGGVLLEGTLDLAFEESTGWVVVDFKTDEQPGSSHRRQLELYAQAIAQATSKPVSGVLLYL
jgi:ATP-dependent exoDNAse (exonuclease V) beta subunit